MIVPQFWAEARVHQARAKGRPQVTVRRFGWSDTGQAEAERMADERAREAFARVVSGAKLKRREPKVAYNGAQGVPIREEVLSRHGEAVITRNAYGAHCLNTPDVLFADVDFEAELGCRNVLLLAVVLVIGAVGFGLGMGSGKIAAVAGIVAAILAYPLAAGARKLLVRLQGGAERRARARIEAFVQKHPDWSLRLYRTPAGYRVLALHRRFDANEPAVAECFTALGVDPVYATMCRNQHCFRARLSAKPWRVGVSAHLRPRPGVWPVSPAGQALRQEWVRHYEAAAAGFAACRFVEALGGGAVDARADAIRELHDRLSQALSGREIA